MAEAHPFYSAGWFKALEAEAQRLLDADPDGAKTTFRFVERYSGAPSSTGGQAGFVMDVRDGRVSVTPGGPPDVAADLIVDSQWEDVVKAVIMPHGPEYDEFRAWRVQQGRVAMKGDPTRLPQVFAHLHDAIAARTSRG